MLCWPRFTSDSVLDGSTINSSWWLLMVLMPKGWICLSRQNIKRCVDDFYLSLLRQSFFFFPFENALICFLGKICHFGLSTYSQHTQIDLFHSISSRHLQEVSWNAHTCLASFAFSCLLLPAFITESKLDLCRIYMFLVSFHSWFYAAQSGALLHLQLILMEKIILH